MKLETRSEVIEAIVIYERLIHLEFLAMDEESARTRERLSYRDYRELTPGELLRRTSFGLSEYRETMLLRKVQILLDRQATLVRSLMKKNPL